MPQNLTFDPVDVNLFIFTLIAKWIPVFHMVHRNSMQYCPLPASRVVAIVLRRSRAEQLKRE